MKQEAAETLALNLLAWIAAHEDLGAVFLGSTGASVSDMREGATDPEFLVSVLDFLLMDDRWVAEFCDSQGIPYAEPLAARQALPGADLPNWT